MKIRTLAALLLLTAALSGCSTGSKAILQTVPYAYGRNPAVDNARLNPNYRYLRVTIGGRAALLALGDVDGNARGQIEVWYSAEREVLRLQNGRLAGAVGLTTEWRNVVLPELPSWSAAARSDRPLHWTRMRDVMPGYRFGVKDKLVLRAIAPPQGSALRGLNPQHLIWFEERLELGTDAGRAAVDGGQIVDARDVLPPGRYAVDVNGTQETVVYGEQCLAAELCFTWQRWPAQAPNMAGQTR